MIPNHIVAVDFQAGTCGACNEAPNSTIKIMQAAGVIGMVPVRITLSNLYEDIGISEAGIHHDAGNNDPINIWRLNNSITRCGNQRWKS